MSEVIVGDLNVGRDIYSGGNANVMGNATIKRNLKVEGWLEAKNIKHIAKGLFQSQEALEEAYPEPQNGWVAFVGKGFPADTYIAEGGKWEKTGVETDLEVELDNYVNKDDLNTRLNGYATADQVDGLHNDIESNQSAIATLQSSTEQTDNKVSQLESTLSEHSLNIEIYGSRINENTESIAKHRSDVVKDVARLDAKSAEQDEQISNAVKNANDAIGFTTTIEGSLQNLRDEVGVKNTQVDNKLATIETLNAKQSLWHEAHSIINLHRFVNFAVTESATFADWMTQVPSQLIRNGLIVMINTVKGWEAWQLVNADMYLEVSGYKKLDWDNSMVETQIKIIQAEVDLRKAKDVEQDIRIGQLEENGEQQKAFNTGVENHIMQTENDYIGVKDADGKGALFSRVIALEAKVKSLEELATSNMYTITELEETCHNLDIICTQLIERVSILENKL